MLPPDTGVQHLLPAASLVLQGPALRGLRFSSRAACLLSGAVVHEVRSQILMPAEMHGMSAAGDI